ncbi:flippase [Chloroflexota bacterium]
MSYSYQTFTKNVAIIGIANVLISLSVVLLIPLLTKTLGAYDYGIWAQVNVTIGLMATVAGLGLPYAIVRFLAARKSREEIQKEFYSVFGMVLISALVFSALLIIFSSFLANVFFNGATQIVIITGFIIFVWLLDSLCLNIFPAFGQMRTYSAITVAEAFGRVGLIAILILKGYDLFSAVLSILIIRAILFFVLAYLVKTRIGIARPHFYKAREYLSFSIPTIPADITGWVVASSDRYVVSYFLGVTAVGIYSAAYVLGNIPYMLSGLLSFVLLPTVSRLYDTDRMNEVKIYLRYTLKYFLALTIPFIFGAAILGKQVLSLFSTQEIAAQGHYVVGIIALGTLFLGAYSVISHILILVKKMKIIGVVWIISASVNLGLNILIVPRLGVLGAAITTSISYLLALGIVTYFSFREFRFSIEPGFIIKSLVASAAMSAVVWLIAPQGNLATVLIIAAGVVIYGLILLLLKGFKKEEISFFLSLLKKQRTTS